jgi:hypothetical protein
VTYAAVDTIVKGTRTGGDISGQIEIGLLKQAAIRILAIGSSDSKESSISRSILEGSKPSTWVTMVLEVLDIAGNLGTHTDAQVDVAIATTWTYLMASRTLQ